MRPENERIPQGVGMIHSYPWYFDDWLLSQTRMSMNSAERGLYRDVLDICYRDGKVPDDTNLLIRMLAVSAKEFKSAWPTVRRQLVQVEGGLSHPRVLAELPDLQRLAEMRTTASRAAARTRWAKAKHAKGNASGMRDACEPQCESNADLCPAFTITTTTTTEKSAAHAELDHNAEFMARWERWPPKGRTRQPLCEQRWCDVFVALSPNESRELLVEIDAGLDRWLNSQQFERGFVFGFADFLSQRRWNEQPEQVEPEQEDMYSMEEQDLHFAEFQRLRKEVGDEKAHVLAAKFITDRRRNAKAAAR